MRKNTTKVITKVKGTTDEVTEDSHEEDEVEEDIDLDEILREMGYGEEEEEEHDSKDEMKYEESQKELEESLFYNQRVEENNQRSESSKCIKLLFTNKLFRSYNLTNDQKVKVVETLDRTNSVREVKLVFSTLAESLKFNGNSKR